MKSRVDFWLNRIDEVKTERLKASGTILENAIKDSIRDQGLILTSRMINDIQYQPEEPKDEVRVGSTITDPPYPFFLNEGFVHAAHKRSSEEDEEAEGPQEATVGPYKFMQRGASASEGPLRAIWKQKIR